LKIENWGDSEGLYGEARRRHGVSWRKCKSCVIWNYIV